ncbi:MAG: biopolymer transporter ExbD [Candidatus Fermentibacteraceae bacterium]|nr:biopolymer transporter ExbD [Candidatus Fermentibacteraceae bacterium]MBN2609591.1 biopolymer transporter ExbD [Candidatus Fermentibacteraceae bacterium]
MKFKSRMKVGSNIFTGTMADIVFLLLVFFMATTLFKEEGGLRVRFPQAHPEIMSELGKQFLAVSVWIKQVEPGNDDSELVARIGDYDMPLDQVAEQLSRLSNKFWREQNKKLDVVVLNVDTRVPMEDMVDLFNSMRFEEIYSIQFNAEERGQFN